MHHFLFPSKDTYITNLKTLENKNFGIDEILTVASQTNTVQKVSYYQSSNVSSSNVFVENVVNFQGQCDAYFSGSTINVIVSDPSSDVTVVNGNVVGYVNPAEMSCSNFVTSDFTGDFTGSLNGYVYDATINGVSYSDEIVVSDPNSSGSVTHLSGSVSGSAVTGEISGSVTGLLFNFSGSLNGVSGTLLGSISGSYEYYEPHFTLSSSQVLTRSMIKFDITSISSSISKGEVVDPKFTLSVKVLRQSELPFDYTIYAYPISQSWSMGDGRFADDGTDLGASWNYRDENGGEVWYPYNPTTQLSDYLTNESNKSTAFRNGGGTWCYSVPSSFINPTSSVQTPFYTREISIPTFDQQYSSSLDSNLSSSFDSILSSSLASVLADSTISQQNADAANDLLRSIAVPTYENTSGSIADYLSTINTTSSLACSSCSLYQSEYSSSTLFVNHLSSSIQTILNDSSSAAYYSDNAYAYDVYLSSSMYGLNPTTFDEVYSILNDWSANATSASLYAINVNTVYTDFSSSLSEALGTTDPYLIYVSASMSPSVLTSSLSLMTAQFTSSATNDFSSSLLYYINQQIEVVKAETSSSVSGSLTQSFDSPFYDTLITGSSLIMSQSFSYESSDIKMDVTPIVKSWISGCIPNEGIILLTSEELSTLSNGALGFYSKETNTIYTPCLDITWDDSEFVTDSLEPIDGNIPFIVTLKNIKKEYKHNSIVRVNVFAREKFPLKNFTKATQQTSQLTPKYLPVETYYSIKDTETEEVVIDFDEGTKLSCDSNGNYFMLDMTGLPQERYFKILIKTEIDGAVEVIDNNTYFKVVR